MKLTEWYSGDQKPVRVGVYEVMTDFNGPQRRLYNKGKWWKLCGCCPAYIQNYVWRGVAK